MVPRVDFTKVDVFKRLAKVMEPDGFLALGAAETVVGLTDAFKPHPDKRGLYRPNVVRAAPSPVPSMAPAGLKAMASAGR